MGCKDKKNILINKVIHRAMRAYIANFLFIPYIRILMKARQITTLLAALALTLTSAAQPAGQKSWNEDWYFTKNGVTRKVNLPHDAGTDAGKALYSKVLHLTQKELQKDLQLEVDGALQGATVLVNGQEAGSCQDPYASWAIDLNPYVGTGDNVIEIECGGLYRNVWLTATEKTAVAHWGSSITSSIKGNDASVRMALLIKTDQLQVATISTRILYKEYQPGKIIEHVVAESRNIERVYDGREVVQTFELLDARLWSPEHPHMYLARTVVESADGSRDSYETSFGIPSQEEWKLQGAVLPAQSGPFGQAWNQEYWECRLSLLKQAGINAISCGEHLPAPELLTLCDRLGLVMVDVQALSLPRDAQHPSVRFSPTRGFRPLADVLDEDGLPTGRELKSTPAFKLNAAVAYNGKTLSLVQAQAQDRSGASVSAPVPVFDVKGPAVILRSGKASALISRTGPGPVSVSVKARGLRAVNLDIQ